MANKHPFFSLSFFCNSKCNPQMVELLPLEKEDDLEFVENLLRQFHDKTGSQVAANLLTDWPAQASQFTKVRYSFKVLNSG